MNPDEQLDIYEKQISVITDELLSLQEVFREYAVANVRQGMTGVTLTAATKSQLPNTDIELSSLLESTMLTQQESSTSTFHQKFDMILETFDRFHDECKVAGKDIRELQTAKRGLERCVNNLSTLYFTKAEAG